MSITQEKIMKKILIILLALGSFSSYANISARKLGWTDAVHTTISTISKNSSFLNGITEKCLTTFIKISENEKEELVKKIKADDYLSKEYVEGFREGIEDTIGKLDNPCSNR